MAMKKLTEAFVKKRLRAWAEITELSLELKRAMMKAQHPKLNRKQISALMRKDFLKVK